MNNFECPRCGHCCQALEEKQEPFEFWSVAEGWVKIDEVREHFDAVGCGTIYKSGGEGRSPLYTTPPKQWVGLTDEDYKELSKIAFVEVIEKIERVLKEKNT